MTKKQMEDTIKKLTEALDELHKVVELLNKKVDQHSFLLEKDAKTIKLMLDVNKRMIDAELYQKQTGRGD